MCPPRIAAVFSNAEMGRSRSPRGPREAHFIDDGFGAFHGLQGLRGITKSKALSPTSLQADSKLDWITFTPLPMHASTPASSFSMPVAGDALFRREKLKLAIAAAQVEHGRIRRDPAGGDGFEVLRVIVVTGERNERTTA